MADFVLLNQVSYQGNGHRLVFRKMLYISIVDNYVVHFIISDMTIIHSIKASLGWVSECRNS